jgi:hypothetical protein
VPPVLPYIAPGDHQAIAEVERRDYEHPSPSQLRAAVGPLQALPPVPQAPLRVSCDTTYRAKRISGRRPVDAITYIVLHCTQGGTAQAAARWFENDDSRGSAHLVIDDNICYRTMQDIEIPWGAPGANYHGLHIEQAGFVTYSSYVWSHNHRMLLHRTAYKVALHCVRYDIPPWFVTAAGLRAGTRGVTTHAQATLAFGGDHTDPGPGWPRYLVMNLVRTYYADIKFRRYPV